MKIEDLYSHIQEVSKMNKEVIGFKLILFPPNGEKVLSLDTNQPIVFFEEPDDANKMYPTKGGDPLHFLENYYYMKMIGDKEWTFVGKSNDRINNWEVECDLAKFKGKGAYIAKAIMYGEDKDQVFMAESVTFFDVV